VTAAGDDPDNFGLAAWVVFAGTVGDEQKILRFSDNCTSEYLTCAVEGSDAQHCRHFLRTYQELHPGELTDPRRFLEVMDAYARYADGLFPSEYVWVQFSGDEWQRWTKDGPDRPE
jgi:hypothetical protein